MRLRFLAAGVLLAVLVGCGGGPKFVPVSGVVKVDGKPYGNAVVRFQPMGGTDNPNPGAGSAAYTDENGRFELKSDNQDNGAVVGKHLVRIMTKGGDVVGQDPDGGSSDEAPKRRNVDPIPPEWNSRSDKEFVVPAVGTDQANFDIPTKRK